jgi:hypothetical protein
MMARQNRMAPKGPCPSVTVQWTLRRDVIEIRDRNGLSVEASYYDLKRSLDLLTRSDDWVQPCPTCKGMGDIAVPEAEPRDIIICPTCKGFRTAPM